MFGVKIVQQGTNELYKDQLYGHEDKRFKFKCKSLSSHFSQTHIKNKSIKLNWHEAKLLRYHLAANLIKKKKKIGP